MADRVSKHDVLVNKCIRLENNEDGEPEPDLQPRPLRYKSSTPGSAARIMVTSNGSHSMMVKVKVDQQRVPEVGDKFSSRHGQKGVVGIRIEHSDMPFTEQGLVPDIIMNPHGFPSRMTVGKLLELISGKAATVTGSYLDASAFADKEECLKCAGKLGKVSVQAKPRRSSRKASHKTPKQDTTPNPLSQNRLYSEKCRCKDVAWNMGKILQAHGYSFNGEDVMISGTTGEYVKTYIFTGPVYYQRLKHMVGDKIHARAIGKKTFLTRQPLEGRSKDGGLRLGEMERDCLLAYGASQVLFERFLVASDDYTCVVCAACGIIDCLGECFQTRKTGIFFFEM